MVIVCDHDLEIRTRSYKLPYFVRAISIFLSRVVDSSSDLLEAVSNHCRSMHDETHPRFGDAIIDHVTMFRRRPLMSGTGILSLWLPPRVPKGQSFANVAPR